MGRRWTLPRVAAAAGGLMKWRVKARIQNAIASLPFGSMAVYYAMQRTFAGLRRGLNDPVGRFRAAIRMVDWIEEAGGTISGRRFVEIGTGHMVNVPIALWLMGAGETVTVDLNRYLSEALVKESAQFIRDNTPAIRSLFGVRGNEAGFDSRLRQFIEYSGSLDDLLTMMNIRYLSPCDATTLPLASHEMDFHVSNTVLEHIPAGTLPDILREAQRVLASGGMLVHFIDPSDHFSHSDLSITAVNFLEFSDKEWQEWAGNRFMYHNRLRSPDYVEIFQKAGVHILRRESKVDEIAVSALDNGFRIDLAFSRMTTAELATTELCLLGRFDDATL
jgi:SAM-dependent methyltransferase